MKIRIILLMLTLSLVTLGCNEESNDMTVVDTVIDIGYIDSNGMDLLDPENPNAYDTDQIKIYHLIDGEKVLFFEGNLDCPKGYFIYKEGEMEYYNIRILETGVSSNDIATAYIELDANDTDTITSTIITGENSYVCKKVLYNGILVWAWEDNTVRKFVIEKP